MPANRRPNFPQTTITSDTAPPDADQRPPLEPKPTARPAKTSGRRVGRPKADAPPPREVPVMEVQSVERVPAMACPGCGRAVHPQIKRRYPDRVDCSCQFCGERWYYYPPRLEVLDHPPAVGEEGGEGVR